MAGLERYSGGATQEEVELSPSIFSGGRGDQQVLRFSHDRACVLGCLRLKRVGRASRLPSLTQAVFVGRQVSI